MASSPASVSSHLVGVVPQSAPSATSAPRQTPPASTLDCKDHNMKFNSPASLNVHLCYHNETLLSKWATQQQQSVRNSNGPPSNEGSYDESPPINNNLNSITKIKQEIQPPPVVSPHAQPDSSTYFHTGEILF